MLTPRQIALELARKKAEQDFLLNLQVLDNTTRTLVGVDARSLFNERDDDSALPQRIVSRLSDVRAVNLSVRNKIEVSLHVSHNLVYAEQIHAYRKRLALAQGSCVHVRPQRTLSTHVLGVLGTRSLALSVIKCPPVGL